MQTVLITGGIGVGKSWAINWLRQKSQLVFQADSQAKKLLQKDSVAYSQLKKLFSELDFYLNGNFNKEKLAQTIFQDLNKKKAMEAIIHPLVRKAFKQFVAEQKKSKISQVFYEAPLISKSILQSCDKKVLITCPISLRKQRLLLKGWTEPEIEERFLGQILDSEVENQVDLVIDNSGDFKNLELQLNKMLLGLEE